MGIRDLAGDEDPVEPPDDAEELAALDELAEGDRGDVAAARVVELLHRLEPPPPLPLTAPFVTGLASLVERWDALDGSPDLVTHPVGRRVLALLGDRLSVTVDADGITARGLLRRRRTAWARVRQVVLVDRYELVRDHAMERLVEDMVRRARLPIPGLRWLLRRLLRLLERFADPDQLAELRASGGAAVQRLERRGRDLELSGLLALVSFLSESLTTVVVAEARARGIPVAAGDG